MSVPTFFPLRMLLLELASGVNSAHLLVKLAVFKNTTQGKDLILSSICAPIIQSILSINPILQENQCIEKKMYIQRLNLKTGLQDLNKISINTPSFLHKKSVLKRMDALKTPKLPIASS